MKRKPALLVVAVAFLLSTCMSDTMAGEEKTIGVKAGDWAFYHYLSDWSTEPPQRTPVEIVVQTVSSMNVTFRTTMCYLNDATERPEHTWWRDAETGQSNDDIPYLILANLSAGDILYTTQSTFYVPLYGSAEMPGTINDTLLRRYASEVREVNHVQWNTSYGLVPVRNTVFHESVDCYWDKATGILVEWKHNYTREELGDGYSTSMFLVQVLADTNMWGYESLRPEFDAALNELNSLRNITYVFMATTIILTATTVCFARKKKKSSVRTDILYNASQH